MHAWRLRTQPAWRLATWIEDLRQERLHRWPGYLWHALLLNESEFRVADPGMPSGWLPLFLARGRRLRRGLRAVPQAMRSARELGADYISNPAVPALSAGTSVGQDVPAFQVALIGLLDRLLLKKRGIVIRTAPDFDDQGLAMCEELLAWGEPITWLTVGYDSTRSRLQRHAGADKIRVLRARSARGVWAYLRAEKIIHTHGLYHAPKRSRGKVFVNLWHGMPVKRLVVSEVAWRQTDILTVTSHLHAEHIREAWHLTEEILHETGLPRNDRMLRAAALPRPDTLVHRMGDRPLVLWLPTYRKSEVGEIRSDGTDFGNPFQLPDANVSLVSALAANLGIHLVLKLHPMAPRQEVGEHGDLSVWDEGAIDKLGITLYELLGHADALITDHSSVWVDFLMLDRPMVFTIADMESYAASRGHYFTPLEEHLPGPMARDLEGLEIALADLLQNTGGAKDWAILRARLRPLHHRWLDDRSAHRVAQTLLGGGRALSSGHSSSVRSD